MNQGGHRAQAERFAAGLVVQSAWPALLTAMLCLAAPFAALFRAEPDVSSFTWVALLAAVASGLVTLALSVLILFDALLFRLIASYETETAGTAAVDDLLMRMRLKPAPARNRPLADRMSGARHLVLKQRVALAFFIATAFAARLKF